MGEYYKIIRKTMKDMQSLEIQAKTKFTIQNKKGQQLLSAHEYIIERYIENLKRSKMPHLEEK